MKLERAARPLNAPSRAEGEDAGDQADQRGRRGPGVAEQPRQR